MNSSEKQLIQKKRQLLKMIELEYEEWDQSVDKAIDILSNNQERLDQMEEIDEKLSKETKVEFLKKYHKVFDELLKQHKEMIQLIRLSKEDLQKQMKQVSKKKKVVNDYIQKDESMFIDRDI